MIDEKNISAGNQTGTKSGDPLGPKLWLDDDGIIHEHHHEEFVTKNLAMFAASERKRLAKGEKKPLLVTFDKLVGFATDTRDMDLDIILGNVCALAYAADPGTPEGRQTKKIYESFFTITPWPLPVKIFDSEEEAIIWLKTFV